MLTSWPTSSSLESAELFLYLTHLPHLPKEPALSLFSFLISQHNQKPYLNIFTIYCYWHQYLLKFPSKLTPNLFYFQWDMYSLSMKIILPLAFVLLRDGSFHNNICFYFVLLNQYVWYSSWILHFKISAVFLEHKHFIQGCLKQEMYDPFSKKTEKLRTLFCPENTEEEMTHPE